MVIEMSKLQALIESEISDLFAGFGQPGEPENPVEMQQQLVARIMPLITPIEAEPVSLEEVIVKFREGNEGFPVERFRADWVISWVLAHFPPVARRFDDEQLFIKRN
ncbi:hypothetical protein GEV90_15050 [Salmonella enterica]|nr:hypothetical protein [Salmonella enterica]EDI9916714.1 hypothetical protein [Salmonella enterica]